MPLIYKSLVIQATPKKIYNTYVDLKAIKTWLPPAGMEVEVLELNLRVGGTFRLAFRSKKGSNSTKDKTTSGDILFSGSFMELVPNEKIVHKINCELIDPGFVKPIILLTILNPAHKGTLVSVGCISYPEGINLKTFEMGIQFSLENLAKLAE